MSFQRFTFALIFCLSLPLYSAPTEIRIVSTIKPIHSLVSAVLGDTGTSALLVTGTQTPHGFQLKPSHMKNLLQADAVFYVDAAFETFLAKALKTTISTTHTVALAREARLPILPLRGDEAWESHSCSSHDHHHHCHSTHQNLDWHVWLDPDHAIAMLETITETLSTLAPEHQKTYQANTRRTITAIKDLDAVLQTRLAPIKTTPYMVFHDAYQYFEIHYGLQPVGSITINPSLPPSAKRLKTIRQKIQDTQTYCIFREPQFSDNIISTITEDMPVRSGILDPLGADFEPGPELYLNLLTYLTEQLVYSLETPKS